MLSEEEKMRVKELVGNAENVEVFLFSEGRDDYKELLEDVSDATGLKFKVFGKEEGKKYGVDLFPTALFSKKPGIRFSGLPAGYEFATFLEMIKAVAEDKIDVDLSAAKMVGKIEKPIRILVFTTPTCPYCPQAVRVAHRFAFINENITSYAINAVEFPELSEKYGVYAVPKIVVEGERVIEWEGAVPEKVFAERVAGV